MKAAYPIILTKGKDHVIVYVPDFDINTQGTDIPDAIAMARDAVGLMGLDMHDAGEKLPEPSEWQETCRKAPDGAVVSLVDVDFSE